MKHGNIIAIVLCAVVVLIGGDPAEAASSYKVNAGASTDIDEFSVCKKVTNGGSKPILVPTKSSAEWSAFRSKLPTGVTLGACPVACGGTLVGGYCWYAASTTNVSCDTTCASRGGCNLAGTRDYAGSGGADANCMSVLTALGFSGASIQVGNTSSGCYYNPSASNPKTRRGSTTTTCAYAESGHRRMCACNN